RRRTHLKPTLRSDGRMHFDAVIRSLTMQDKRASTITLFPSSSVWSPPRAVTRRTLLMGLAALTAAGAATRVRADDLSAEMILNDPEAPIGGNPDGNLTIVSFFDYNCPFCKRTVGPLNAVMAS